MWYFIKRAVLLAGAAGLLFIAIFSSHYRPEVIEHSYSVLESRSAWTVDKYAKEKEELTTYHDSESFVRKNSMGKKSAYDEELANYDYGKRCADGPRQNLMFLKTHKTGGSTLQNILMRKAFKMNAFVGLPARLIFFDYYLGRRFRPTSMRKIPSNRTLNMLMHHMVFDRKEVLKVMPADSIYLTILREPGSQFESVFNYMRSTVKAFTRVYGNLGVGEYLNRPTRYYRGKGDGQYWWFGKNNVMFDFGFDNTNESEEYLKGAIKEIEETFNLVVIAEYFDISVLLIKDLLCWDIEDVVYLTMNSRNPSTVERLTETVRDNARKWNKADTAVYDYFNKTFWEKVKRYGERRLKEDLKELQRLKDAYSDFCVEDEPVSSSSIKKAEFKMHNPKGTDITQHILKSNATDNSTCIGLILPEKSWIDKIAKVQYPQVRKPSVLRAPKST